MVTPPALRRRPLLLAAAGALVGAGTPRWAAAQAEHPLVVSVDGALPLLMTVPHDGDEPIDGVPPRRQGTTVRDLGTRPLAEQAAQRLAQRLGAAPRLVIARFSRKTLDANRDVAEALESPEALPVWQAYHGAVARHVAALRAAFPGGALLLDIHGQGQEPDLTFRGTRAGLTARALVQRHGLAALQGEHSVLGGLAARGLRVDPEVGSASPGEDRRFAGGYTVFRYGSHRPDGIDAIQLEFGSAQRRRADLPRLLADAVADFLLHYGLVAR